jgi:DNA invertase Pin-like site-specific DNA recombinase
MWDVGVVEKSPKPFPYKISDWVREMHANGSPVEKIVRKWGISEETVRRWVARDSGIG